MAKGNRPGAVDHPGFSDAMDAGTLAKTHTPVPGPVGLQAKGGAAKLTGAALRNQIAAFARQRIDQHVGNGQCFDLVDRALQHAGAKSATDFGTVTHDADYVWGDRVELSQVRSGDIIQFRNYRYDRSVKTTTATQISEHTDYQERPHHTAIVDRVGSDGMLRVLEQNVPDGDPVKRSELFFRDFTSTGGNQTTTVTVRGQFRFYRAQPH